MAIAFSAELLSRAVRAETERQFERSIPFWDGLENANILMTGCSGLFGVWLLDLIDVANDKLGVNIRAGVLSRNQGRFYERYPRLAKMSWLNPLEGDIRSFALQDFDPTHLIHGATTSAAETFRGEAPLDKFDTLVSGTNQLFSQIRHRSIHAALFLSSGAVYGTTVGNTTQIEESMSSAPNPSDVVAALGHAKRAAEFLCHAHAEDQSIPLRVARCFAFSGAGLPLTLHYALGDFVRQALTENRIIVNGDGKAVRSYLHLGDMAIWLIRLLAHEDRSKPSVVNVGSPAGISIANLAIEISSVFTSRPEVIIKNARDYSVGNPVRSVYVPCTKVASTYGLSSWTDLRESITNMIDAIGRRENKLNNQQI
jgi:nucleoside-diphosphate-sugar epimerase